MVHPAAAGPASTKREITMMTLERKNNQKEIMFNSPEAISRAPICNGINKLLKVPLNPAVRTKNTIMVPCMVTKARYTLGSMTPSGAHFPKRTSKTPKGCSGQANCNRNKRDIAIPIIPINNPVIKYCFEIIL